MRLSEPMPQRDLLNVGADLLAKIGDLVDEGDLHRQKGVGGIFDQFRRAACSEQHRRLVDEERPVDLRHHVACELAFGADDDAVRMLEVLDRRAFAQELRIGNNGDIGARVLLADDALDLVARTHRYGRFGDHDRLPLEGARDLARRLEDILQIGMTITAPRRRADSDEYRFGLADSGLELGGEGQTTFFLIARQPGIPVPAHRSGSDRAAVRRS